MESVLILFGAIGFSFVLNQILLTFSKNFGVDSRQAQNIIRWGSTSKPTTGGISFYITFLVGTLVLLVLRPDVASSASRYLALFASATLAFLVGFADDAYGTHPGLKFLGQIFCGVILIAFGIQIHFFTLWAPELWVFDWFLTVFWVVGMMNSLNMLDNMDGVTTTVALSIIITTLAMIISAHGLTNLFYIFIAVVGSFAGFLYHNWRPARIYMGDTGSMFIGLVLAFGGIMFFWNIKASPDNISHVRKALIPLMVFLVPVMDTTFVTFARLARGSSPFVGGKDHLTHHLVHIGIPERFVPVMLGIISLVSGGLALFAYKLIPEWNPAYSVIFTAYPVCIFALFTYLYRKGGRIGKMKDLIAHREKLRLERISRNGHMSKEAVH